MNEEKCEEYLNGWKRALADYDNLKKELAGERVQMKNLAIEQMSLSILPVLDNFDQALRFKPVGLDDKSEKWLQGILHVRTQLENMLQEIGLEPFGKEGELFDPHLHDAIAQKESKEKESGTILEVQKRGWKHGERLIRPAIVIVSK
ncbi:nucleotide exchange factor GrpE [Candidatus Uhrbacteria bacterium]|nr:nucleotide exchange factor GrpE [Candidatus Uhrbacteria bacterium]